MPLDLMPSGRNPIVFGTTADSPRLTHPRFLPPLIFPAECTRLLCRVSLSYQTTLPVGCTRRADVRVIAKCADMFPLVFDYSYNCFLLDLLQLLLLLPLLLSQSAHGHAVRLKIPLSLRTARVPTIILPSRGFSCCCTSQLPQGYHPPCVQLRLHHKVPTMVVQHPSLQHLRWVAIDPHRTLLVPRAQCWSSSQPGHSRGRPCSNILAHEAAPEPTLRYSLVCS